MPRKAWSEKEVEILKEKYGTMPRKELQETFFPDKTLPAVAQKAVELGITKKFTPWTDAENDVLIRGWTVMPKDRLLRMLPGRTWTQCGNQVKKLKAAGKWPSAERRNYAAIEPEERKRRSDVYDASLKYKMGLDGGTSVRSFTNNRISRNNKTGVRGVSRTKSGKFTAYIRFRGKLRYLGLFPTLDDAAAARADAIRELQPEIDEIAEQLEAKITTSELVVSSGNG